MTHTGFDRAIVFLLRILVGWTFLYAGITQTFIDPNWTAASFLAHTKTFHVIYGPIVGSSLMPLIDFCIKWGRWGEYPTLAPRY